MNVKRMLALLLAAFVSVTAMSSILADGSVSGPAPKASDLPGDALDTVTGQWTMDELKERLKASKQQLPWLKNSLSANLKLSISS